MFLVGPGCFIPIEQELARSLAARRAAGIGGGPVIRRAATLGGGALFLLTVLCAVVGIVLLDRLFDGEALLVVGLLLSLAGYYAEHLARGVLAGYGRFRPYGIALATEGTFRLVGCAVLAVLGVATAGPYGVVLGAAPLVATAIALRGQRDLAPPGPEADRRELTVALGWLLAGSVLAQALANAGPVAVKLLADDSERAVAGRFLAALIVARVPLFLFTAVLAPALPRLARMAAAGDRRGFDAGLWRLLALVTALSGAGIVGALVAGPTVVRVLFGSDFELPGPRPGHPGGGVRRLPVRHDPGPGPHRGGRPRPGGGRLAGRGGVVRDRDRPRIGPAHPGRAGHGGGRGRVGHHHGRLLVPLLHHRVGPAPSAGDLLTTPPPGMTP